MGASRDSQLAVFADRTGVRPAFGKRLQILQHISGEAFELIKIVELEISGIRDGDGFWGGCDPLDGCTSSIRDHYQLLCQVERALRENAA